MSTMKKATYYLSTIYDNKSESSLSNGWCVGRLYKEEKEFRDTQGTWEAIWNLVKEHPTDIQTALHKVIDAASQRLSIRKAGISYKAIFKAVDWTKAKKNKGTRDALVWGKAIVEDEDLKALASKMH